eukprot:CAMPEP_0184321704 /NCGR_PEP_ID=MMETSP1049-20130417/120647_1 /TAXON_ID=77928 /ORGANISM="Proteomonas sulcata, Strain CCMP704" /LENGTH=162 /DNA_ID=CAMNT_0026642613 /DNA_START=337 /DNA_END=825 /DNA_ORIENTATION=+
MAGHVAHGGCLQTLKQGVGHQQVLRACQRGGRAGRYASERLQSFLPDAVCIDVQVVGPETLVRARRNAKEVRLGPEGIVFRHEYYRGIIPIEVRCTLQQCIVTDSLQLGDRFNQVAVARGCLPHRDRALRSLAWHRGTLQLTLGLDKHDSAVIQTSIQALPQ